MAQQPSDSLGGQNTFSGPLKKPTGPQSLGDQNTFSGGSSGGGDTDFGDDLEIVDLSARYTMGAVLGKGGMGEVLLATDNRLNRKVAIKRMLGEGAKSRTAVSRFLTEAKSIAALNHPNIVQIYDYGRDKSGPFLILEFVDGCSLLDLCRDGAMPLERAVDLISQLSDGLSIAHDARIIHRDIKPANVLLTKTGIPKLTDFGLAKDEAGDSGLSMAGAVLGTLDFMPPEQRNDAALVDSRSDLWSLAATLYQMVTGELPRVIDLDLVPQALRPALAKALKAKKDDRYQTAVDFRDALRGSLKSTVGVAEISTADLGAGECSKCHTKNESNRRFCRKCATSLEVKCLSCSRNIPVWDEVCGDCGAKQSELITKRQGALDQQRVSAEAELRDGFFAQALATAVDIRDQLDARFEHLKSWADEFIPTIATQQEQRESAALALFEEARTHGKSHDYTAADHAMQQIPEVLQTAAMRKYRKELTVTIAEIKELKEELRIRTKSQSFDGLMSIVDRYLTLQPGSAHAQELLGALVKRDQRLDSARSEALAAGRAFFASQNYVECCNRMVELETAAKTTETESLRTQSQSCLDRSASLSVQIKSGLAAKKFTGLQSLVDEYLRLNSRDAEMQTVRTRLLSRDEKLTAQTMEIVSKAKEHRESCRFDAASKQLRRIPESQQSSEILDLLSECDELSDAQTAAMSSLDAAITSGRYEEGLVSTSAYRKTLLRLGLTDSKLSSRMSACEAAASAREARTRILIAVSVVGLVFAVVVAVFTNRSFQRAEAARVEAVRVETVRVKAARAAEVERVATLPPFANSIGMSFRLLPGGPDGEFSIGVHEVTQSQYTAVMGSNPSKFRGAKNPVENVGWNAAVLFCEKLSALPAERAAGRGYRLPTEAEWEYSCRAGTTTDFSFGDDAKDLGKYAWFAENSDNTTHAVGEKLPNARGLYDMHGNVWEWCSDVASSRRVACGGGWSDDAASCRSANRGAIDPTLRTNNFGFRVALSPSETALGAASPTGAWTDLLNSPEITSHTICGEWTQHGTGMIANAHRGSHAAKQMLTPNLSSFEVEVEIEYNNPGQHPYPGLILSIPVSESRCFISFWAPDWCQLAKIRNYGDGKTGSNQSGDGTPVNVRPNERCVLNVKVRKNGSRSSLLYSLNGASVIDWTGDATELSEPQDDPKNFWRDRQPKGIAIGVLESRVVFHSVRFRPL